MLSWRDFDTDVVDAIYRREPTAVDKSSTGGLRCPLAGHDHWLRWNGGDYTDGTEAHGDPAVSFRAGPPPTFIYVDHGENLVFGRELADRLADCGKAETWRLGNENSEDAVSWNVFRAMQEAGRLGLAANALAGLDSEEKCALAMWACEITHNDVQPSRPIADALDELEAGYTQQTEPDIVLHRPGWGWLLIEAKLASPTSTYARRPERVALFAERYSRHCPDLFDGHTLRSIRAERFPEQILRNMAVGYLLRRDGETAMVVALVRDRDRTPVEQWVQDCVKPDSPIDFRRATWEQLYAGAEPSAGLSGLREYMQDKSVGLRPAFRLDISTG